MGVNDLSIDTVFTGVGIKEDVPDGTLKIGSWRLLNSKENKA